jgi:hypothetical protein
MFVARSLMVWLQATLHVLQGINFSLLPYEATVLLGAHLLRLWRSSLRLMQVCVGRPRSGKTSLLDILGGRRKVLLPVCSPLFLLPSRVTSAAP